MFKNITQRKIVKAFDRWAPQYEVGVEVKLRERGYSYEELALLIVRKLNLAEGSIALELGVGSGVLLERIAGMVEAHLVGIDISRSMIEIAQRKIKRAGFCQSNAENLPFLTSSIDSVYSTFMLHSVINQSKALQEIKRVLKPDGKGVLVDLCIEQSHIPYWTIIRGNLHSYIYEYGALSMYRSVKDYRNMLEECGLKVLAVQQLGKPKRYAHFLIEFKKCKTSV